jgi:small-conductance mechanosensitive channel
MNEVLHRIYFNNSIQDYLIATGSVLLGVLFIRIFQNQLLKRLKHWAGKTETYFDDYVIDGIERFGIPITKCLIIYAGLSYLNYSARGAKILHGAMIVVVTFYAVSMIVSILKLLLESHVRKQDKGDEKIKQLKGVVVVISIVIWGLGFVFLFDNLGYDVTAVITGLGIGGIAIALAAQNILGDLFNYFVIFFDRPFEIGDFIMLDDKKGHVEYIGIKTTRLKSLTGEQLIIGNSDLTKSRLHNFKHLERRRIVFTIGIVYETSLEHVKEIPILLKQIIEEHKEITFERAHFLNYGAFSLNYEVVFFVESPDFVVYADIHQQINFRIFEVFQQKGIAFAYPSQTIFIAKDEKPSVLN